MSNSSNGKLVLGLRPGESVIVGDNVEIMLADGERKVSLLFIAPKSIKILRSKNGDTNNAKGSFNIRS